MQANRNKRKLGKKRRARRRIAFSPVASIVAILLVTIICIGTGIFIWNASFTRVNLADYSTIKLEGYDKHGTASLEVLGDAEYSDFFRTVEATLNMDKNLSNGDEITITYNFDEEVAKENKLRIEDNEAVVTVNGLSEAREIDRDTVFSGLNLSYTGMSPCIQAKPENTSEDVFVSQITYSLADENKIYYEAGDTIEIIADIPAELLDNPAYSIDTSDNLCRMEYKIPYGDSYLTDANQISDEMLAELEEAGFDLIRNADAKEYGLRIFQHEVHLQPVFVGNTTTFKWVNPYVISAYFHSITDEGKKSIDNHANDVQIVYGVTLTQADGTSVLTEVVIQFVNLVECEDGTHELNLESGRIISATYRDSNIKKLVAGGSDGAYNTTKLTE